jgi:UDP-glucuronate 4-epimerase
MKVLVTGVAGFIGMHVAQRLLSRGDEVVGIDNLSPYYDPQLKRDRLTLLQQHSTFRFVEMDIADRPGMHALFSTERLDGVVHLAAQAGVRYSLQNPHAYVDANLVGFMNVLEGCRHAEIGHLVYASSSSVYGGNTKMPFEETDPVNLPQSLYAATKRSNEMMAYSYSHLFRIPMTGLRFFTVYGPWGRPDMAPYLFTDAIAHGRPIKVFNEGRMQRDFTYIDDITDGVVAVLDKIPTPPRQGEAPMRLFNIGNCEPVPLSRFIAAFENALGMTAVKDMLPMQPGDVIATHASNQALTDWVGFRPSTPVEEGVKRFVDWYCRYVMKKS